MNRLITTFAIGALFLIAQLSMAQAPAGAPAGSTGLCNDGTYYSGASKKGACRGHKGVKDWYGSGDASAPAKTPASTTKPTTATNSTGASKAAATTLAPSTAAPAGATGVCNDGTYYMGATKQGACRGHKGIKEWYGATTSAAQPKASPPATAAPTPAPTTQSAVAAPASRAPAKESAASTAPAPGGGGGKVWLNTTSNVYHCEGSRFYGKTKAGAYMSEADTRAKGARPDHGKACK